MKVRALKSFEGIRDNERTKIEGKDIYPKAGDEWEVSEERGLFLQKNGVVEIVEEKEATGTITYDVPEDAELKVEMRLEEKPKKKKNSKK